MIVRHKLVEWRSEGRPVRLARLQEFLGNSLPRFSQSLRRGKGILSVAEDAGARWDWQVSGRVRYACRREPDGFKGAAPWSCIVLIFATNFPDDLLAEVKGWGGRVRGLIEGVMLLLSRACKLRWRGVQVGSLQ